MSDITTFTQQDMEDIERFLRDPKLPDEFETWVTDKIGGSILDAPASLLLGQANFLFRVATPITTEQGLTSSTYTDLATSGPELTGLANGQWLVGWGFLGTSSAAVDVGAMGISVNGSAASDTHEARCAIGFAGGDSGSGYWRKLGEWGAPTLDNDHNNSILAKYRRASGTGTFSFSNRWLVALRVGDV